MALREHISIGEVWDIFLEKFEGNIHSRKINISTLDAEITGLELAEDIISKANVPHYNASAVDGYALDSRLTSGASPATPVKLVKEQYCWLNTGMAIPEEFNSVLMVENSTIKKDNLFVYNTQSAGTNVRSVGEDVSSGQVIARKGDIVSPYLAALLPCAGIRSVSVIASPRVVFIPTGDEIISKNDWLEVSEHEPGTIMESNSIMLRSLFKNWGMDLEVTNIIPDDREKIESVIGEAVNNYDMILVGAGSAKGRKDHVFPVLQDIGEVLFHWTLMKPGRPAMGAIVNEKPVIGLPGFPMSTAVTAWSIVYPILQLMIHGTFNREKVIPEALGVVETHHDLPLMISHSSPAGIEEWLRIKVVELNGRKTVVPFTGGSSKMLLMSEMDGISLLPAKSLEFPKGTTIPTVWITKNINWENRVLYQGSNDPALDRIISFVRNNGGDIVTRYVGSLGGLAALKRKECHFAAVHLLDPVSGKYNDSYIKEFAGNEKWRRLLVYYREQGIIVKKGNPRSISTIQDLTDPEVNLVNRQPGAGTRVLLDHYLDSAGIDSSLISGYNNCSFTHFDAASQVKTGIADVALGIRAAATEMDLDFIPLTEEPFELVIPESSFYHKGIQSLIKSLDDPAWRSMVEKMGGYRWAV